MYHIGGWEEKKEQVKWVGARVAASMRIYTKKPWFAMVEDMRKTFRVNKMNSIIEAINLVCVDILEDPRTGLRILFGIAINESLGSSDS